MNLELDGKLALVTGASSGIGASTARILAEEGADVIVAYGRNRAGAMRTADEVRRRGRHAWELGVDLSDPACVPLLSRQLSQRTERLDILILCSGSSAPTPFDDLTVDQWRHLVDNNLHAHFYVLKAALSLLGDGASVVTVASVAAHTGVPHDAAYAAGKDGLVNLTKSAARALAPRVRVNCVAPGITLTPMGRQTVAALESDYAGERLLAQRFATADEVARCIVFVASPVSSFMVGATIDINGGRSLR
jgi:3-oxoacyl-[acyl-carrier protein] reductase